MADETKRFLGYLADEREAARLYRALAQLTDGSRRTALLELADIEDRHAAHWIAQLTQRGVPIPTDEPTPGMADEVLARARSLGLDAVLGDLEQAERDAQGVYDSEEFAAPGMADDERIHERTLKSLRSAEGGSSPPKPTAKQVDGDWLREQFARAEPWHRADKSGALRAAIFGVSDGLVSNAALIMGFAGSGVANKTVAFAGLAGLLAGAFSMAAGEYVSVASQREVFAREIALEAAELADHPQDEERELKLLYQAKGMDPELAAAAAARIMSDPKIALDTLVREELGLDPQDLGSPVKVAGFSFAAFAVGAALPLLPFVLIPGNAAIFVSILLTGLALLLVGGSVGRLSGAGIVRSALRQFAVGAAAAIVTYLIGLALGGSVGIG